jgi:transcriptional regulator with XRE-family HTH domain
MKNEKTLPEKIKQTRLRLGITAEELGELLGVAKNTIARWERGAMPPGSSKLIELALEALVIRHLSSTDKRLQVAVMAAGSSFEDELAEARDRAPRIRQDLARLQKESVAL